MAGNDKAVVHLSFDEFFSRFPRHDIEDVLVLNRALDRSLSTVATGWQRPSADEALLVSDAPWVRHGAALDWAEGLRDRIQRDVGLDCSVGIAATRVAARICSRMARPRGVLLWLPGYEKDLIADIPLEELDELSHSQVAELRAQGVRRLGELAVMNPVDARSLLGSSASKLVALVRGLDEASDRSDGSRLARGVMLLTRRLSRRLVRSGRRARGLELQVRFEDGVTKECYTLLPRAVSDLDTLSVASRRLLETAPRRDRAVAGMVLTATGLTDGPGQLSLFQHSCPREVGVQLGRTS